MNTREGTKDAFMEVFSDIHFQPDRPSREDLARKQCVKTRVQSLMLELTSDDDRQLAAWCEWIISFSAMAIGMKVKWTVKQLEATEAALREANEDDEAGDISNALEF